MININYIIMDFPRQKISFVELQLLHIISWSHDAYGSVKGQSGYTYYSPQFQNQEKSNYSIMFLFWKFDSSIVQMVCMIEGKSYNKRLWGRNSQVHDNGVLTIGSYITVLNPLLIPNRLGNEIPIVGYRSLDVIMDPQMMVHSVRAPGC